MEIDWNSIFQRRGQAPEKSNAKWRFHALICICAVIKRQIFGDNFLHWRTSPSLRSSFLQLHRIGGVRMVGKSHAISTATLKSFKLRASQLMQRARSQSVPAIKSRSQSSASDRQDTVQWPSHDLQERTKRVAPLECSLTPAAQPAPQFPQARCADTETTRPHQRSQTIG